jgi:enolase
MIKGLALTEVYNSCKEKTVKVSLKTDKGIFYAISPVGTSKGSFEAKTIDNKKLRTIFPKLKERFIGKEESDVDSIIEKIGMEKIGSGFSIAISMAAIRELSDNKPYLFFDNKSSSFPFPLSNVIGGGAHNGYQTEQEFLVVPMNAKTMKEATDTNISIWKEFGRKLKASIKGMNRECAWMCKLDDIRCLDALVGIADEHGARVGIDFAANSFYNKKSGHYSYKNPIRELTPVEQLEFVLGLIDTYNLAYVEDPFHENDFDSFAELTKKTKCLVAGDDLFVTNAGRLEMGIEKGSANSIIIKPNQAGTISRTMMTVNLAKRYKYSTVVSHRSCETDDTFISDLAVGTGSPVIKIGAHGKDELKLKRLIEIWNETINPAMCRFP